MNTHKNARLVYARPHEMLRDILYVAAPCAAAAAHGVSAPTARKWPGRYLARGEAGGAGRFSRSAHSLRAIAQATVAGASTPGHSYRGSASWVCGFRRFRRIAPARALSLRLKMRRPAVMSLS